MDTRRQVGIGLAVLSVTLSLLAASVRIDTASISTLWIAAYAQAADGTNIVTSDAWRANLGGTQAARVALESSGTSFMPTDCAVGAPCPLGGDTTPPATTPPTTAPATTLTPAVNGGVTKFAPYVDTTLWPTIDMPGIARATGLKNYTLGFVVNGEGSCSASWGTYYSADSNWMGDQVAALRAMGGDVIASFGGSINQELALTCPSVEALAAQYQAVIDRYGLTSVDFDIEGAASADAASVDRRSKAVALVQQRARAAGRPLEVSLTLPVLPTGLVEEGINVVRSAREHGVDVSVVNVMVMDYGFGEDASGQMGNYAVQAAASTHRQLQALYPSRTDAQLWAMVGITPMIGQNDIAGEVFSTADARQLTDFARSKHLARLAMWSSNRDSQCPEGVKANVDNLCSGVLQEPHEFSTTFGQLVG